MCYLAEWIYMLPGIIVPEHSASRIRPKRSTSRRNNSHDRATRSYSGPQMNITTLLSQETVSSLILEGPQQEPQQGLSHCSASLNLSRRVVGSVVLSLGTKRFQGKKHCLERKHGSGACLVSTHQETWNSWWQNVFGYSDCASSLALVCAFSTASKLRVGIRLFTVSGTLCTSGQ